MENSAILNARDSNSVEGGPSFSFRNRLTRLLWQVVWFTAARWTPVKLHRWRIFLINLFGGRVNRTAHVYPSASIWLPQNLEMEASTCLGPRVNCYCMDQIKIGAGAIISQDTTLCGGSHDISDPHFQLIARPIIIGSQCWIAAEAFVGPGVTIGNGTVVGARAVVFKDVANDVVVIGNPARVIKSRVVRSNDDEG